MCTGTPRQNYGPVITVQAFDSSVKVGTLGRVLFQVLGPRPVTQVQTDLIGDGAAPEAWMMADGRRIAGLYFLTTKKGVWQLQVQVTDSAGCQDTTGVVRQVTIK